MWYHYMFHECTGSRILEFGSYVEFSPRPRPSIEPSTFNFGNNRPATNNSVLYQWGYWHIHKNRWSNNQVAHSIVCNLLNSCSHRPVPHDARANIHYYWNVTSLHVFTNALALEFWNLVHMWSFHLGRDRGSNHQPPAHGNNRLVTNDPVLYRSGYCPLVW